MEEASVAGESPDRSKQRKSSGTARSESDPRLAVFREEPAENERAGGTDTATAVFGTGRSGDGDGDADGGSAGEAGSVGNGKADTATAVFRTPSSARAEGAEDAEEATGTGSSGEAGRSGDVEGSGSAEDSGSSEGSEDARGSRAPGDSEGRDGSRASEGAQAARGSRGAEEAAEGAAGASGASQASGTPRAGDDGDDSGRDDGSDGDADADAGDAEPGEAPKSDAGDAGVPAKGDAPEADRTDGADAVGGSDESDESDVDAAGEDRAAAKDAEPGATGGAEAAGDSEALADTDKADRADRADRADGPDGPDGPDEDADKAAEKGKDADGSDEDAAKGVAATGKADQGDERGGDQPTAVFRSPAPKIDQPTTALKITSPPEKPASASEPTPESAAERTSKFVPLRQDDVRPSPKPDAAPGKPAGSVAAPAAPAFATAERTTQQPMPPKPPLDLLAELTNTPPPPDTPVRVAVRRVKIWTPLVLLVLIIFAIVQMVRPLPDPELGLSVDPAYIFKGEPLKLDWPSQGGSAVSVDGVGSMGSSGAQKPAPIASVAKVMTAYVILKEHPISGKEEGEKITVDQQAEDESKREDESTAPITKGQQFTQKQMLQLLMIPSGNNAARLFARWDSPSEKEFVAKMNAAAKDLGMTNTTYTDPSGLDKSTVSTAEDQIKLARAVMQNDVFREIVDTPQIKIPGIDQVIYNNNTILLEPGVSGIKTGSSTPAGGNLLWSANTVVDGQKLWIYGAVMGQQAGTGQPYDSLVMSLENSLKVIKGAQKAVTSAQVVKKGDVVGYVDDGLGGRTPVVATRDLKAKGWSGLKVELSVSDNGKAIPHSAAAGTVVGAVTVGSGPGKVSAPVALKEELKSPGFGQKLTRLG
ncbi:serine hydrolase [Streptomyces sp. PTD5-9]|uniref:serine hydrolase n=1 Tax=Streptomyces sp. PTD5-9 TaxID=3120150 RepID=UPI00300865D5